ncbi:glycosyltransferase family protein [Sphingobacterium paucimobilis]|uniref:Glycosyltransferase subfamily 4-like N-terminal domain-containing protein n=1 Tax=Sphingobacterium paucimobilis HER1398 TaxID=1346330 RepID=U2HR13_9SPHI|nr:hypothetical protein [Sphingobacterium paucimobilis]ERJ57725.1 hypothetical protein M472_02995 [Sphingobacterium paucimobilis HER1398]
MKIVYVLDWDIIAQSSVLNKICAKISYWEMQGNEVHLMIVSSGTVNDHVPRVKNVHVFERPGLSFLIHSSIRTFIGRNMAFGNLYDKIKDIGPDVVYLRPGSMWYPNVSKVVSRFPSVLELNSIDEEEVRLYYPKGDIRYSIFSFGRDRLLKKCVGIVGLTDEIVNYYSNYKKKTIMISNGVNFKAPFDKKKSQNETNIIFVGTPGQLWQGFDQFVEMARLLPEFKFHLVGPQKDFDLFPDNLICHGFLQANELSALYEQCQVGVGTLALFRKNMKEACPLKVREYVANKLFLILGYIDSDFHETPFTLYIGNNKDNVSNNIERIRSFVLNTVSSGEIDINRDRYSIEAKENMRLSFLKDVI